MGNLTAQSEQDELEYLSSATLTKRKDFIDREEEARNAPNRVLYYRRNADNDRLIQVCTDKLQGNPQNVRALLIRAASYVKKGELEASVLDYSFVLQIEADHVEATFHRGTVYEKLGKLDEAIADFSKVLSLEPDHVKASYARGTCRNLKGDFAPAIEDYAKALEKDKQALKPRRKSHIQLGADSKHGSLSSGAPNSGLIPTARTAPTAAYQPYLDGAHLNSRPGTPAEASPNFAMQSGSFGAISPHDEASPSFAVDSAHIFPESHHSQLATSARPGDVPTSSGSQRDRSQTLVISQHMHPRSHPIQVTGDDMERSLSELDLGQLTPAGDDTAATSRQASQSSMMNSDFLDARQRGAASSSSRPGSRPASFTGDAAGRAGKQRHVGQHRRRSSSGEEQSAAATSHFKLPAKQLHVRHVMQEPPLSTRSSYRMDSWENEHHSAARSDAPTEMSRGPSLQAGDSLAMPMEPLSPTRQGPRRSGSEGPAGASHRARLAHQHHAKGYSFRKQGNFAAAIEEYSQAIALEPHHFKALFNRGFSWDKVGNHERAIEDYTQALQVDPQNSYAFYNRGITRDGSGDYEGAVEDFSHAIRLDPANADFFHNRGFSLRKMGRFEEALKDYTAAIQLNPRHCRAFYNRAFSNDRLRRYDAAVSDYTRALEIQPGNATAYHNRASLFERLGRLQEALADFEQALSLEPKNALSHNARGLLLEKMGKPDAALTDFEAAVQLDGGTNVDFLRNRGLCFRARRDYNKAVEDFDRVLQRSPSDLAALSNRGYAFRKLGKFAAASEDYTAALKQSPGTVRLHNNRGYCLAKLGKYKSAIQDYQRVIQLDPANAHAYHNRGISFDKLGQFEQAVADFTTVLKLDPTNVNAYFNRGSAYDSLGQYEKAVADYTHALDLDSSSPDPDRSAGSTSMQQQGRLQSVPPSPVRFQPR
ncbi:hypothetical protein ABBQ38_003209 [Trebouxia sp. C0009 RCD-2024]